MKAFVLHKKTSRILFEASLLSGLLTREVAFLHKVIASFHRFEFDVVGTNRTSLMFDSVMNGPEIVDIISVELALPV